MKWDIVRGNCERIVWQNSAQTSSWPYLKVFATELTICITSTDSKAPLHISALLILRCILYRSSDCYCLCHGAKTYCCSTCWAAHVIAVPCYETCTHDCHAPCWLFRLTVMCHIDCRFTKACLNDCTIDVKTAHISLSGRTEMWHAQYTLPHESNELCMMYRMTSTYDLRAKAYLLLWPWFRITQQSWLAQALAGYMS